MPRTTRAGKRLLSGVEIEKLLDEVVAVAAYVEQRRAAEPLASHIQLPKLPPILSESIVGLLLLNGAIPLPGVAAVIAVEPAGIAGDLFVTTPAGKVRVEVKGTTRGFTLFNAKDVTAPFVIWLDVGPLFRISRKATVHVIPGPGDLGIVMGQRLTSATLARRAFGSVIDVEVDLPRPNLAPGRASERARSGERTHSADGAVSA